MSADPLPQRVNIRKAVTRRAHYEGSLGATELPQFRAQLGNAVAPVFLRVDFGTDDQDRQFLAVAIEATVELECQRCLETFLHTIAGSSRLALVHSDEQAAQLPREYEPLIAFDEVDLWAVAAEELALALPVVAYHATDNCQLPAGEDTGPLAAGGESRENPFSVLSTLLADDDG